MKTMTAREFFQRPNKVKAIPPGQTLIVTANGKPSLLITKAGERVRRSRKELEGSAIKLHGRKRKLDLAKAISRMRSR